MAPAQLPSGIVEMEAARAMRLHHMLWHTARNSWLRFPFEVQQAYKAIGWAPPRPAVDANRRPIRDNKSGEDFLFMHRDMIAEVNRKLATIADPNYPRVRGWDRFPSPGDADYPVPPAYVVGNPTADDSLAKIKSDEEFAERFQPRERELSDDDHLRTLSLGELGCDLEFSVHNWAHRRWASKPDMIRPAANPADPTAVGAAFDAPAYNWLEDFYSSHVNPTFWKLHGWVDARIDQWMAANAVAPATFQWVGTWNGPPHAHGMHRDVAAEELAPDVDRQVADTERLLALAAQAGLEASPRDVDF